MYNLFQPINKLPCADGVFLCVCVCVCVLKLTSRRRRRKLMHVAPAAVKIELPARYYDIVDKQPFISSMGKYSLRFSVQRVYLLLQ